MTEKEKQQLHEYGIDRKNITTTLHTIQVLRGKKDRMPMQVYRERMQQLQRGLYSSIVREFAWEMYS